MATNATLLNEKKAYEIIDAGLDFITFSFEGVDKETYESIRKGANYEGVLENILRFLRIKDEQNAGIRTVIEIIEMRTTTDKIPDFTKKFDGLSVDEIRIKPLQSWAGTIDYDKLVVRTNSEPDYPCNRPWRMLAITWDGLFLSCCVDSERKYIMGDAHNDSIEDVWNGEKIQYLRNKLRDGKYNEIELCRNCKDKKLLSERFTFPKINND